VRKRDVLRRVFRAQSIGAVVHFAGLQAVGESVAQPLRCFDNNAFGSIVLLDIMAEFGVTQIAFSSA
jgi:UDP-glucose 4-epimerase